MAVGLVDRQKLVNIADAVRAKKGITGNMTLDAIASNITSMPTADNNAKFDFTGSGSKSDGNLKSYFTNIDLSSFDTSNYTDMGFMFYSLPSLTSLDLSNFNTSKVTKMNAMFGGCSSLTSVDLSSFDTSNVTDMSSMFSSCKSLTSLDLSNFNTSNVTDMSEMFNECSSLTSLDLSSFDTSNVTDMRNIFYKCSSLTSLDLSNWNTSSVGTSSYDSFKNMFFECRSLESLDISSFDLSNTYNGSYYSLTSMFSNCQKLKTLKLPNSVSFNKSDISFDYMFNNCYSLESLDFTGWDTTNVTSVRLMFDACGSLKNLTLGENWASNSSLSSFDLSHCPLTHDSAVEVLNKLATRDNSPVIKFSSKVALYQSEIDIATNKGWSVSGCSLIVEDPSTATVGQFATIDGVFSKCVYVADTAQSWGQKVFIAVSSFTDSNGNSIFEWGGSEIATDITATAIGTGLTNTNSLIAMNLQSTDGTPTIWDAITEFRNSHSDSWFVPSLSEFNIYPSTTAWSSSEYNNSLSHYKEPNGNTHVTYKNNKYGLNPAIYV